MLARRALLLKNRYGPELITNGRFTSWSGDNPTGWTLNFTENGTNYVAENANGMEIVCDNSVAVQITQSGIMIAGLRYLVTVVYHAFTLGGFNLGDNPNAAPAVLNTSIARTSSGAVSGIIVPATANFSIRRSGAAAAIVRSVSCRRVL